LQYRIKEVYGEIENSLELLVDVDNDLTLKVFILISIFMFGKVCFKLLVDRDLEVVESVIFVSY